MNDRLFLILCMFLVQGCVNSIHKQKQYKGDDGVIFNIKRFDYSRCNVYSLMEKKEKEWVILEHSLFPIKGKKIENTEVVCLNHSDRFIQPYFEYAVFSASGHSYGCELYNKEHEKQFTPCNSLFTRIMKVSTFVRNTVGSALTMGKLSGLLLELDYDNLKKALIDTNYLKEAGFFLVNKEKEALLLAKNKRYRYDFGAISSSYDATKFIEKYREYDPDSLIKLAGKLYNDFYQKELEEEKRKELAYKKSELAYKKKKEKLRKEVLGFRKILKIGHDTHCGMVIDINGGIVKIQTVVGEYWLRKDQVFPKYVASCDFLNNVYQPPIVDM